MRGSRLSLPALLALAAMLSTLPAPAQNALTLKTRTKTEWTKEIQQYLAARKGLPEGSYLNRCVAVAYAEKVYDDGSGQFVVSQKMADRPGMILGSYKPLAKAIDDCSLPEEYKRQLHIHYGCRFLFPIRQNPPRMGIKKAMTLLAGVPAESKMVTIGDGQTLAQLITAAWPGFTKLSPLQQKLVYDGMAAINPNIAPEGSCLSSDPPGIRRADIGVELEYPQMDCLVEQFDPGLRLIPKAVSDANKDKPQGDILVLPVGDGKPRACRYRIPAGAQVLMPAPDYLAQRANPKTLTLRNEWIRDLALLKGLTPTALDLAGCDAKDLKPLAGMKTLKELRIDHMPVTDLAPLKGLPLVRLCLVNVPAADLSPLKGMPLEYLDLKATPVKDLTPLKGMKLKHLNLDRCPADNLVPLVGMPFEYLQLNLYAKYPDINLLKDHTIAVAAIGDVPRETWVYEYDLLQSGNADTGAALQACGGEKKAPAKGDTKKPPPTPPPPKKKKKDVPRLDDIQIDL